MLVSVEGLAVTMDLVIMVFLPLESMLSSMACAKVEAKQISMVGAVAGYHLKSMNYVPAV